MPWTGRKKIALVPVYRPHFLNPPDVIPPDWPNLILQRMVYDPQNGVDRSLRAYIRAASSGLADLDAVVQPMQNFDGAAGDVEPADLDGLLGAQLRQQGFDVAALVMLGGRGAGTALRGGFWARFVMAEDVGTWAMEFMHCLTDFDDLYPFAGNVGQATGLQAYNGNIGNYDEMASNNGTHPTAYTKAALTWLDPSTIAQLTIPTQSFNLHSIGLPQPPPTGRVAAVRIGTQVPYIMVEARQRVDQFDAGIPAEGVIVYRVQTTDPHGSAQNATPSVVMLTLDATRLFPTAIALGQTYTDPGGLTVRVTQALPGGFSVTINDPNLGVVVPNVFEETQKTATAIIKAAGLVPVFTGPSQKSLVLRQKPDAGQVVARGSTVTMTMTNAPPK
jgi:PASTA domain